ncbi:MAG: hypothetical protein OM95_13855 [Bdellovibrio sp. ArHS]|uniref:hypothetical protein n=1 Tax=Bdellovibrio sp. ArHS TaxID=1569284 RepID=UPI000583C3B7|nr:hypothetical protein [Bdellovibrio sp. ArHS]KHD87527.1 MAG: hypothetical protein OM95_13855 [Bdellovibrio sp. ArHS]
MRFKKQLVTDLQVFMALSLVLALNAPAVAQTEGFHGRSQEDHRAAFDACREELGLPEPTPGERPQAPDEETREKMDACLKEKGFEPPKFGRGPQGGRPPRPNDSSSSGVQ